MTLAFTDTPVPGPPGTAPAGRLRAKLEELFSVDLRSLALLRIGLGVSVLADVTTRAFDLVGLYTDSGVMPRDLLLLTEGRGVYFSAHFWASAHPLFQSALFAITAVCALALLVGWRTRLATLACWYLVASVQIRQPLSYMGGDSTLRLLLFWASVSSAERSLLAGRGTGTGPAAPRPLRFGRHGCPAAPGMPDLLGDRCPQERPSVVERSGDLLCPAPGRVRHTIRCLVARLSGRPSNRSPTRRSAWN